MARPSSRTRQVRARYAAAKRWEPDADHEALRTSLKAAILEDHCRKALSEAPPLTEQQKARIAALFGGA